MTIADLPPAGRAPPRPAAPTRPAPPGHGRRHAPNNTKGQAGSRAKTKLKPKAEPPPLPMATSPVRIDTAPDGTCVDAGPLNGRQAGQPRMRRAAPVARSGAGRSRTVVARLWRTAERQVREIEDRLMRLEAGDEAGPRAGDATQGERDAKTLAILAKTIRDLADLSQVQARPAARTMPSAPEIEDGYDPPAADLDELRRELARKLAAIQSARDAGIS